MKYRSEINGLRALAVIPVILFHAGFDDVFSGGFVGVDVFFVISGYLITSIIINDLEKGQFNLLYFYERRVRRILPALFFVVLASIPLAVGLLTLDQLEEFSQSLIAVATFSSNIFFWHETGYFNSATELKPLIHTWSLAVEEQYYILFPLLLMALWRYGKRFIVIALSLIFLVSLLVAHWAAYTMPVATFFLLPTRAWELLIGALTVFAIQQHNIRFTKNSFQNFFSIVGLVMIGLSVVYYDEETPFPSIYALLPTVGTALIIIFGNKNTVVGKFLSIKPLVGLGLISYSAYLWHQPLFAYTRHIMGRSIPETQALILVILSLGVAFLSWKFIETPFRQKTITRKRIFQTASIFTLIIVCLGVLGSRTDWFRSQPSIEFISGIASCPKNRMKGTVCELGNRTSKYKIIAYGDSHLAHITKQLVHQLGSKYSIDIIYTPSCFMGEVFQFENLAGKSKKACKQSIEALKNYKNSKPLAVITAQRWHGYGIKKVENIQQAIDDRISAFGIEPLKLIILGSTAGIPFTCEMTKFRPLMPLTHCKQSNKTKIYNQSFIDATSSINGKPNVHFVYPYSYLCPNDKCTFIENGIAHYVDHHHLSFHGGENLVREISKIINE